MEGITCKAPTTFNTEEAGRLITVDELPEVDHTVEVQTDFEFGYNDGEYSNAEEMGVQKFEQTRNEDSSSFDMDALDYEYASEQDEEASATTVNLGNY